MVRCPSGVTRISDRPVGSLPPTAGGVVNVTPAARISWPKTCPELILRRFADEGGAPAERGNTDHRVGDRTPRNLNAWSHGVHKGRRPRRHRLELHAASLLRPWRSQEGIIAAPDDIDDGDCQCRPTSCCCILCCSLATAPRHSNARAVTTIEAAPAGPTVHALPGASRAAGKPLRQRSETASRITAAEGPRREIAHQSPSFHR